jgi:hypothetical protein
LSYRPNLLLTIALAGLAVGMTLNAQESPSSGVGLKPDKVNVIESIVIHPIMKGAVFCSEHYVAEGMGLGDALGSDCLLSQPLDTLGPDSPYVFYRGAGTKNEDWFGWGVTLLAPVDGIVEDVFENPVVNTVGRKGKGRASMIIFSRNDGARVVYAHVAAIYVKPGQAVRAGQAVGTVGNNGQSKSPHTHVGAWRGRTPLQVRFDLSVKRF